MKKGMIILVGILIILIIVVIAGIFGFKQQFESLLTDMDREYAAMGSIDMSAIPDGVYSYRFGKIPVYADLSVHVKEHVITHITMHEQSSGPGYDARETMDRIIQKQQARVDVVTGATISSKCIMIATYKALTAEK
ncbi:MAG: FMN-binding protein [FCB group bacterium]|nr:FMN-binding protein [FCB group bacterium]